MKRKKKAELSIPLEPTSSFNRYFMCICGKKYTKKLSLTKHVSNCSGMNKPLVCHWCKLEFKNRGNLVSHAYYMHGDISGNKRSVHAGGNTKLEHNCDVCEASYSAGWKLKHHIRRQHFNLWAKIPDATAKQVNQVWFEKVLNSNLVVQIKKTGRNTLVMKPTPQNDAVTIHESDKKVIDLRSQYPTGRVGGDVVCKICQKTYRKVDLPKHMNERHFKLTKHTCNNCNQTFKRAYIYLKHVCHKGKHKRAKRKVNGVVQSKQTSIKITSIESLKPVVVD